MRYKECYNTRKTLDRFKKLTGKIEKPTLSQCKEKATTWFERALILENTNPKGAQTLLDIATIWELKTVVTAKRLTKGI